MSYKTEILSTKDLCKMLEKSEKTIYNWRANGMPYHKVSGRTFYMKSEVEQWLFSKAKKEQEMKDWYFDSMLVSLRAKTIVFDYDKKLEDLEGINKYNTSGFLNETKKEIEERIEELKKYNYDKIWKLQKELETELNKGKPSIIMLNVDKINNLISEIKSLAKEVGINEI